MIKILKKATNSDLKKFMYNKFQDCADDSKLYDALNSGKALNVFQMSAGTASQVVNQIKPANLSEMTACNAFARPGTISGVPNYVDGKSGHLKYHNEIINSVFGETFGVCLYQEQIMKLFVKIGGHTDGGNYIRGLLKKLGKANKKQEDIDAWKKETQTFSDNARKLGISETEIKALIEDVAALANYSFNKSHALAYSMMAAWTLYLNVYFNKYYYPAVIEYAFEHEKETLDTLKTMRNNGFNIVKPNLINSKSRTYSDGDNIYVGLHNLKQVGNAADGICDRAPYTSFRDFMCKNLQDSAVNKRAVTALVEFGCFDELDKDMTRRQMISGFNVFWDKKPAFKKISAEDAEKIKTDEALKIKLVTALNNKIEDILKIWDDTKSTILQNEYIAKVDRQFLKDCEAKYLGFNFFVTPFDESTISFINDKIRKGICVEDFNAVRKFKDISKAVPVYVSSVREYHDKNGGLMAFLNIEDKNGNEASIPIFASAYSYLSNKISQGVIAFMLMYNSDDSYHGGEQLMLGTKKWISPDKYSSFVIPIKQE